MRIPVGIILFAVVILNASNSRALPDPYKAKQIKLCAPCASGQGSLEFGAGDSGAPLCLSKLLSQYKKQLSGFNKCLKPIKKQFKGKLSGSKYKKAAKKCGLDPRPRLGYLRYLDKRRAALCDGESPGPVFNISEKPSAFPGQLCHMEYYRYDCSVSLHVLKTGIEGAWNCASHGYTTLGAHQDLDVALIKASARAAERIIAIGSTGFDLALAQVQAYVAQATPIVQAGGTPPALSLDFTFALSPQGQERFSSAALNPLDFMQKLFALISDDFVARSTNLYLKYQLVQGQLLTSFGSPEAKNAQGVAAVEGLQKDALALMQHEWGVASLDWTHNLIERCLLVN